MFYEIFKDNLREMREAVFDRARVVTQADTVRPTHILFNEILSDEQNVLII